MKLKIFCAMAVISTLASGVSAQSFFSKVTSAAGSVVNTAVKVTTAPYEAVINTAKVATGSANPNQIFQPYQQLGQSAGQATSQIAGVASDPQRFLYQRAAEFASRTGGQPGEFIFDVSTFSNQFYTELANTGAHGMGAILQGQNPLQLSAAPLAAAINAARERHSASARPIPADVKIALRGHFPDSVLNRAKYSVGKVQITLPNFIGRGNKLFGNDYAVVVDDIIVFSSEPPTFAQNAFWWSHEMTHVQQYENMGVAKFAYNYLISLGSAIENEADAKAASVTGARPQVSTAALSTQSFDQTRFRYTDDFRANPEFYVAQCIFPYDRFPVNYLITNYGRIIAVNPLTGEWVHIGHATPPLANGVAWTYQTPNLRYAVLASGQIMVEQPIFNPWGYIVGSQVVQVGHVVRLQS